MYPLPHTVQHPQCAPEVEVQQLLLICSHVQSEIYQHIHVYITSKHIPMHT